MRQWKTKAAAMLAILLAASSVLMTGCKDKDGKSGDSTVDNNDYAYAPEVPKETVNPAEEGQVVDAKFGESKELDNSKTSKKVTATLDKVIQFDDATTATGMIVLSCELTIKNESDEKIDASTITHFTVYQDGVETPASVLSTYAMVMCNKYYGADGMSIINQEVAPGETITGRISIEVGHVGKDMYLQYTPFKYYSNDTICFYINEEDITHQTLGLDNSVAVK